MEKISNKIIRASTIEEKNELLNFCKHIGVIIQLGLQKYSGYYIIEKGILKEHITTKAITREKIFSIKELIKIYTETISFPRKMKVWNDKSIPETKIVIGFFNGFHHAIDSDEQYFYNNQSYNVYCFKYATDPGNVIKLTKEQIEENLGYKIEIL